MLHKIMLYFPWKLWLPCLEIHLYRFPFHQRFEPLMLNKFMGKFHYFNQNVGILPVFFGHSHILSPDTIRNDMYHLRYMVVITVLKQLFYMAHLAYSFILTNL